MINRSLSRLAVSYCRQIQERQLSFHLTDTQREIQATALQFAQEELLPAAPHHDRTGEFPWELINKAHDLGLRNPQIPEEYGGPGLSTLDAVLIKEALSFGCSGLQMAIMGPFLAVNPLLIAGNEQQKKRYLCELATEPCVASYCVTETNAGSDVNGVKTTAVRKGDEYVINGSKCWITGGGHARWFYVLARTAEDPATPAGKAFSAFIVDGDSPGIERGSKESMMGQRCSDTRTITFEDVRVPIANRVGGEGDGFKITMAAFDATRPCIAAGALGIAWRALSESTAYSIERKTFGQPIASHQAISSKLADMATNLELARLATYRAAVEIDSGGSNASYFASMAKNFAAKIASEASANAVQIFGGNGFSCDFPVEKLMRDSKIYEIYGGTNEIQRVIMSKRLLESYKRNGTVTMR